MMATVGYMLLECALYVFDEVFLGHQPCQGL